MNNTKMRYYLLAGKIIFSILIFAFVFHRVTQEESIDLVHILSFKLVIIICLTGLIQLTINSVIQNQLLRIFSIKHNFTYILNSNIISCVYGLFIPGFIAPDLYLGYKFGKDAKSYDSVITMLILNRAIGFTTSFFMLSFSTFIIGYDFFLRFDFSAPSLFKSNNIIIGTLIFLFIATVLLLLRKKILAGLNRFFNTLKIVKLNLNSVLKALMWKFGFYILGLTGRILIGYIVGISLSVSILAAIIIILNFLISLPVTFNGIGIREAGYVGILSLFGIEPSVALTFALTEFAISLFGILLGTGFYSYSGIRKLMSGGI